MQTMISHFPIGANGLMATFLVMSALSMLIVILATLFYAVSISVAGMSLMIRAGWNFVGLFVSKMWMLSLLSMLALYNGFGGGAASAIATAQMFDNKASGVTRFVVTLIVASVGAASLSGSLIAWIRLNGLVNEESLRIWTRRALGPIVMVIVVAAGGCIASIVHQGANQPVVAPELICCLLGCALLLGALTTLPLRRTQMPIAISLYNACTGLAIGLEGFILRNQALMTIGLLIGAARVLVTLLMVEN